MLRRSMSDSAEPLRFHPKTARHVGLFIRQQYGIRWRDIAAKGRSILLEEVEHVSCNLCGSDDAEPIADRDKYELPVRSVMCRNCGLMYLDPRPTAVSYRRFYEEGGTQASTYHRRSDFTTVEDLLRSYFGPGFEMSRRERRNMRRFMRERGLEGAGRISALRPRLRWSAPRSRPEASPGAAPARGR